MRPHEQRVVDEHHVLNEKIVKLTTFIDTEQFAALDPVDQELLHEQRKVMLEYSHILVARFTRFSA